MYIINHFRVYFGRQVYCIVYQIYFDYNFHLIESTVGTVDIASICFFFIRGTDLLAVKPHDAEVWRMRTLGRLRLKQLGNGKSSFPIAKMTFKSMPKYAKSNQQHENKCISDCNCDTIWYINFNNSICLFTIIYEMIYSGFSMNLNEIYRHIHTYVNLYFNLSLST